MFGIGDFSVSLAYILCILSTILCVVYGIINWNKGEPDEEDLSDTSKWEEKEIIVEEEI